MLRVLIADDHAIIRKGLIDILRDFPEETVVTEASHGSQALELALAQDWDLAVLDAFMPGLSGFEVLLILHREKPTLPVVMLAFDPNPVAARLSLKVGAAAFVAKESTPDELLTAIQAALAGEKYIGPRSLAHAAFPARGSGGP